MQPCDGKWPIPLAAGKVISTQSMQETFSRILQEHYRDTCTGEHVKQEKRNGELQQQVPDQVILGRGLSQKVQTFLSYANYVITSITEGNFFVKKS